MDNLKVLLAVIIEKSLGLDVVPKTDNHLKVAHGIAITLQDGWFTAKENLSENILHGKSSNKLDLTESDSDSDSDSDFIEKTNEKSNKKTSEEINCKINQ